MRHCTVCDSEGTLSKPQDVVAGVKQREVGTSKEKSLMKVMINLPKLVVDWNKQESHRFALIKKSASFPKLSYPISYSLKNISKSISRSKKYPCALT